MISKLPKWVWFGGAILAFIAGIINAVGFVGFQHQGVTHLTGNTTLLGIAAVQGNGLGVRHLLGVIAAFMTGCIFSGFLIQDSTLKLGRRYGVALLIESALLFAATPFLHRADPLGNLLASCACGLQNGMVSTYSGAVLRTTHVTGLFTDLGIFIGQMLRGGSVVDMRRVRLCLLLLSAFFAGSVLGAAGFARFGYATLYLPAALTGCTGFTYGLYRHRQRARG
jgi:uncharacterized membrane protein YoaK (UPF0700 family)